MPHSKLAKGYLGKIVEMPYSWIMKKLKWEKSVHLQNGRTKDILKTFNDFKNEENIGWSNVFSYIKVSMFGKYSIQYAMR